MPHIVIEHQEETPNDFDLNVLSRELHNYLAEHETINKKSIKTRTQLVKNVYVGEESAKNKFIHVTILLLAGREKSLKELIVKNIYTKAASIIDNSDYTLSVEARDLGTYYKGM